MKDSWLQKANTNKVNTRKEHYILIALIVLQTSSIIVH